MMVKATVYVTGRSNTHDVRDEIVKGAGVKDLKRSSKAAWKRKRVGIIARDISSEPADARSLGKA
jgi:hypothetical protein